jgi:hypothetical protein
VVDFPYRLSFEKLTSSFSLAADPSHLTKMRRDKFARVFTRRRTMLQNYDAHI